MNTQFKFDFPYKVDPKYGKTTAYFSMEFAIDQALKIYSGGLGFLAGSHMRSVYDLKQPVVGIGMLWKKGYYDQIRKADKSMEVLFQEKIYSFLEDTNITFDVMVDKHQVKVKAFYLHPEVFGTAPIFLLSTDLPENDYLAQTTSHRLYDSNISTRIAQYIVLGIGGAKLLDLLDLHPEVYHLNEAHALPAAFYLYTKLGTAAAVRESLVLTTHTPEQAGNETHELSLLEKMGFFDDIDIETVREITGIEDSYFNQTLAALRLSKIANGVSKRHGEVARQMWSEYKGICQITSITNAQNKRYWGDKKLYKMLKIQDLEGMQARKRILKKKFFEVVADQTGKILDPNILTIVWARRFAEYKRPDLITSDFERFEKLVTDKSRPVQIIWAGKPYPLDYGAIGTFDNLVYMNKNFMNCAVLVGYELWLSLMCKRGADLWLNNPRIPREASGTSGMTAAMNGAVNFSTQDGWILEFARHGENSFIVPVLDPSLPHHEQDRQDAQNLLDVLEEEILPLYYDQPKQWNRIVRGSLDDVVPYFDSDRMAKEYFTKLYEYQGQPELVSQSRN
jgi:starch phosphorylase